MTDHSTHEQTVAQIAEGLGETAFAPVAQIRRIVTRFGPEQALAWLAETQQVEIAGGMLLPDGSRRRTPGGVYFYLVRGKIGPDDRAVIFPSWKAKNKRKKKATPAPADAAPQAAIPTLPALTEAERTPLIRELRRETGKATSVKVTLIGRPGRVALKKDLVLTTMANDKAPSFPKGLPAPPETSTSYTVYISAKQWKGVAEAIQNEEDALIIEGWAAYDPELEGIAVWVTNCTTKLLQRAKREGAQ